MSSSPSALLFYVSHPISAHRWERTGLELALLPYLIAYMSFSLLERTDWIMDSQPPGLNAEP